MPALSSSPFDATPLDAVPGPGDRRLAVRVTPDALRQIRGGHPWVFDRSITSITSGGAPGDLAVVFDDRRRFAAIGLFDPDSPIRIRILHAGRPTPIDDSFWTARVTAALDRRRALFDDPGTTGFRLIHGENDSLGGLVVDRYDRTLVVKVYTAAWPPHLRSVLDRLVAAVAAGTGAAVERVVLRLGRLAAATESHGLGEATVLVGDAPSADVEFLEHGLVFGADVIAGQKTGHFLDQRDNRVLVGGLAEGCRVLDVFCCTGGFGVHAAAGGAREVHSVDQSGPAVAAAGANLARNPAAAATRHRTTVGDAFAVLAELAAVGDRYDLVIVDPPSFASSAAQTAGALRAYGRLTALALEVLAPDGVLVQSSCSSRVTADKFYAAVHRAADDAGSPLAEWARTGHAVDHPIGFPEGAYLKTLIARRR